MEKNPILLYTCVDSPPGRAVQMVLEFLKIPYIVKPVCFEAGEHFSPKFLEVHLNYIVIFCWGCPDQFHIMLLYLNLDVSTRRNSCYRRQWIYPWRKVRNCNLIKYLYTHFFLIYRCTHMI